MDKLTSWPAAFDSQARKINEIVEALKPLLDISSTDGIKITTAENSITIGFDDGSTGGSGLPSGYGPEEWTVYDGGVVTTRNFLTDNPD